MDEKSSVADEPPARHLRRLEKALAGPLVRGVVLVEGESDVAAVRTYAAVLRMDLGADGVAVVSAGGVTNFGSMLGLISERWPGVRLGGLYDEAEEHHVVRGLVRAGFGPNLGRADVEAAGFFACVVDLEDEMIRALGIDAVEAVLETHGELRSFRVFQNQPAQRTRSTESQLRRFMGTRATRKIRYGRNLMEVLDPGAAPAPMRRLIDHIYAHS